MTNTENIKTEDIATSTVEVYKVKPSEIIASKEVKDVISKELKHSGMKEEEVKNFLKDNLTNLFSEKKRQANEIQKIYANIIDIQEIKNSTGKIIDSYSGENNTNVESTLRKIDNEMSELKPLVATTKNALENTYSFFQRVKHKFSGDDNNSLIKSSMSGMKGRIESFQNVLNEAKKINQIDENNLLKVIPTLGERIVKIESLSTALELILSKMDKDNSAKNLLANLNNELNYNSALLKESLQELLVLSEINSNSMLTIQATETELILRLEPLILSMFVGSNSKNNRLMRRKVTDSLNELQEKSKEQIKENNALDLEEKKRMKETMVNAISKIEELSLMTKNQKIALKEAQKDIDDFMPIYKEKMKIAEQQMQDTLNNKLLNVNEKD